MRKIFYNSGPIAHMSNFDTKSIKEEDFVSKNVLETNQAIIVSDNVIEKIIPSDEALEEYGDQSHKNLEFVDLKNKAIIPGLVDSHTHLLWAGDRSREVSWRMKGLSYQEIANMGGGINYTVNETRNASKIELQALGIQRLNSALKHGTTHLEAKSGYGLSTDSELKLLEVAKSLEVLENVPSITHTWLGAHATPDGLTRQEYVDEILSEQLPSVLDQGIAEHADVFCEDGWFTTEEAEEILTASRKGGLELRLHIDEFKDCSGGELAADLKVKSADHAHYTSKNGREAMTKSGVNTGFLPGTPYAMGEPWPDFNQMVSDEHQFSFGSDFNPNCRTLSLPFMGTIAVQRCGLHPLIALGAVTVNPAKTLERNDGLVQGKLTKGAIANFNILNSPFWESWALQPGMSPIQSTVLSGELISHNND